MHWYSPFVAISQKANYLVWKTDMKPEEDPSLSDPKVRERVVRAWKMVKARDLAKADAQKLADKAKEAKKSFDALSKESTDVPAPFKEPGFSWVVPQGQSGRPELATLPSVDVMSNEFMQTVFALAEGETGTALNGKKDIAYAIYVTHMDPLDKKQTDYLQNVRTPSGYSQYTNANIEIARETALGNYENTHSSASSSERTRTQRFRRTIIRIFRLTAKFSKSSIESFAKCS